MELVPVFTLVMKVKLSDKVVTCFATTIKDKNIFMQKLLLVYNSKSNLLVLNISIYHCNKFPRSSVVD